MDEDAPLTRPFHVNRPSYGWWALQIGIAVFVFLAFLFSILAYTTSNKTNQQFNNAYTTPGSMSLKHTYKVNAARNVRKGNVVSFCEEHRICEGLGPVWEHRPFYAPGTTTPAALASLNQLSPALAVYTWTSTADHTVINCATINTLEEPGFRLHAQLQLLNPVTSLRVRPLLEHSLIAHSWVIMYTDHNITYLQVGTATNTTITFGTSQVLFSVDPLANYTILSDITIAESWIIVTWGQAGQSAATYTVYELDPAANTRLRRVDYNSQSFSIPVRGVIRSAYLGNNTFIQSCANHIQIGMISWTNPRITLLGYADIPAYFRTLHITPMFGNRIAFTGVQVDFVDEPITLSMVVEYSSKNPYLTTYYPTNLLATHNDQLVNYQLQVCYHNPYNAEPFGGLFFTYVDAFTLMAKIVRAKVTRTSYSQVQLLPSPALDISSAKYGTYGSWEAPIITCPTANEEILIAYQDRQTMFDMFTWSGGFRFAGVAETDGKEGDDVSVVRTGVASGFSDLQTGFQYYVYNDGFLAPHTSYLELFTPNGHRRHIGVAISPSELLLEYDAFDPRV